METIWKVIDTRKPEIVVVSETWLRYYQQIMKIDIG
jgi:hypothetical protein